MTFYAMGNDKVGRVRVFSDIDIAKHDAAQEAYRRAEAAVHAMLAAWPDARHYATKAISGIRDSEAAEFNRGKGEGDVATQE